MTTNTHPSIPERQPGEPLTLREAKALDRDIRRLVDQVTTNAATLLTKLEEAHGGAIYAALGYRDWKSYAKDTVRLAVQDLENLIGCSKGRKPKIYQ